MILYIHTLTVSVGVTGGSIYGISTFCKVGALGRGKGEMARHGEVTAKRPQAPPCLVNARQKPPSSRGDKFVFRIKVACSAYATLYPPHSRYTHMAYACFQRMEL